MAVKPGYKQTEVGVIPEDWEVLDLDASARVVDSLHQTPRFSDSGYPMVRVTDIKTGDLNLSETFKVSKAVYEEFVRNYKPKRGDIAMSRVGSYGVSSFVETDELFCMGQNTVVLEPKVPARLLYYILNSRGIRQQIEDGSYGSGYKSLSLKNIKELRIPMPPTETEQRAIKTALSDVDALLGALERLVGKKRVLKQAIMQQLLTGQTRLPSFHDDWEDMQVQDVIAEFFCGPSPTCEERNIQDDCEWGVLKTTAATKENGWDWTKHKTLPRVFWNKPQIELQKGDVIVTKAGPRHRVGVTAWVDYVPPRIIPSGKMIALRPLPDKVVPLMLATAISARDAQTYLDQRTTGMAESQVNFENTALLEAPIRIPRIEEQTAIATVLSDMDAELAALEQRLAKTRALKQGMMQELLTGRTRLV